MLKKGDRVRFHGVETVCRCDEFPLFGLGLPVVELENVEGWVNAKIPEKLEVSQKETGQPYFGKLAAEMTCSPFMNRPGSRKSLLRKSRQEN